MEVALASAALVGFGLVWNRVNTDRAPQAIESPQTSTRVARNPTAANSRPVESSFASATARSVPTNPNPPPGVVSGRRDHSMFLDAPSGYEQQASRFYSIPPEGTKREVVKDLDPSTRQDNVHVRSQTDYQQKYLKDLQRPTLMHNVNPVATTTGTASQLVGPGVGTGYDALTGDQGLHYGMVRMRPNITEQTFREQKGSIIPGKNSIDKRTAEVNLMTHAASGYSITPSGFAKTEEGNGEPLKFHAISTDYLTSAPGRAVATGNPGAGGRRLEPVKDNTNRGADNTYLGVTRAAGVEAADDRYGYSQDSSLQTDRGKTNRFLGPAQGADAPGYTNVVNSFNLPAESRDQTEVARGRQVVNLSAPGVPAGAVPNQQPMQTTQRQTMAALDVINLQPQLPLNAAAIGDDTRSTARVKNEYRPGAAGLTGPDLGGHVNQVDSYAAGQLSKPTQRESHQSQQFVAPLRAVGVDAPMSYADVLKSEVYSNRDMPQVGFVPPAAGIGEYGAIGAVDLRPSLPNAVRNAGGGIGNQSQNNHHIVNRVIDHNPNRVEVVNQRLDPRILDALSQNQIAVTQ